MEKRKRNNLLIVAFILLLTALIGGFYIASQNSDKDDKENQTAQVSVINYNVYDYDKNDFRFVIAEIALDSGDGLNIDLNEVKVNKLRLDNKDKYIEKVKDNEYDDDFTMVDEKIYLTDSQDRVTLFLPIIDKNDDTAVITSKYINDVIIDLNKNVVVKEEDKADSEEDESEENENSNSGQVIDEEGFLINVEPSFSDVNYTYFQDGQEFQSSSSETLHAFPITIQSKDSKDYQITHAKFVFENGSEIDAENKDFKTIELNNILATSTKDKVEGYLMFVTFSQDLEVNSYSGELLVKINNGEWIKLEVKI